MVYGKKLKTGGLYVCIKKWPAINKVYRANCDTG